MHRRTGCGSGFDGAAEWYGFDPARLDADGIPTLAHCLETPTGATTGSSPVDFGASGLSVHRAPYSPPTQATLRLARRSCVRWATLLTWIAWCGWQGGAAEPQGDLPKREVPEVWTRTGSQAGASFGAALAGDGDLNGDGFADMVLGEGGFRSPSGLRCGRLQVFFGSREGFGPEPSQILWGEGDDVGLGSWVAMVGDLDRDGYTDAGVASVSVDHGPYRQGHIDIWRGSPRGLVRDTRWQEAGDHQGVGMWLVARAGDVNGDGFADVVFAAPDPNGTPPSAGILQVFHGSASGLSQLPAWERRGTQVNEHYGARAQSAGDVNGDGYDDLIVGTMDHDGREVDEGLVELFLGSPTGLQAQPLWQGHYVPTTPAGPSRAQRQLLGGSVSGAGDVNRDGFADFIVGGAYIDHEDDDEGRALVWLGRREGPSQGASWSAGPRQPRATFGHQVAGVGDVDGDGFPDVVVTAPHLDHGALNEGVAALYTGGPRGLGEYPVWTADGDQAQGAFGSTLVALGDVNRDGLADFAVGTDRWVENGQMVGQVRVFYGRRGGLMGSTGWNREPAIGERLRQRLGEWGERAGWFMAVPTLLIVGVGGVALWRTASAYRRSRRQMARLRQRVEALACTGTSLGDTGPEARWHRVAEELRSSLDAPSSAVRALEEVRSASLAWAEAFARTRGLRLELEWPTNPTTPTNLAPLAADALEAMLRVALANVVQHARATHAWVRAELSGNSVRLEVGDDGVGFNPESVGLSSKGAPTRHGLRSLKLRVRRAGGRLEVVSQSGTGSRIKVWIPVLTPNEERRGGWRRALGRAQG